MGPCFETTFQVAICVANHYNNLTIDFQLYMMSRRNLVIYAKSLKRQKYNDDMQRAIVAVQKRECGTELAAQRYSVPRSTVLCYLKKEDVTTKLLSHCLVLGVATELEVVHYIKLMESKLFDFMTKNVIEISFTLVQGNKIKYSFVKGYAGCGWLDLFMYHHPELSVRQSIGTSKTRTVDTVYEEMCEGWRAWPALLSELKC